MHSSWWRRPKIQEGLWTLPGLAWLGFFFFIPTMMVIIISFRNADPYGGIATGFSLDAYKALAIPSYPGILWRTLRLSLLTTIMTMGIGIPMAYSMSRLQPKTQSLILLAVIVPFWTNFLIRIYAWKVLLHPQGLLKSFLVALGIISENVNMLYNEKAVLVVLIYTYLPFALLPLYSAAEKFDYTLLEAARDLGSSWWRAFFCIFIPGIRQGLYSAILVVFVPALGSYIIPEIMGGTNAEMLGNKIAQRVFIDRNIPRASALSAILILTIVMPAILGLLRKQVPQLRRITRGRIPKAQNSEKRLT